MIAALYVAAHSISYGPHQTEVLVCFECLGGMGWRIDALVQQLRESWASASLE